MHSHTGYTCVILSQGAFSNVLASGIYERMRNYSTSICVSFHQCVILRAGSIYLQNSIQSHTSCIFWTFPASVWPNESSSSPWCKMQNHIGCIYAAWFHCAVSDVPSNGEPARLHSYIDYIWMVFLQCAFSCELSNYQHELLCSHIGYICSFSHQYGFLDVISMSPSETLRSRTGCIYANCPCCEFLVPY